MRAWSSAVYGAENRELQMRVELLKEATAFFANDTLT